MGGGDSRAVVNKSRTFFGRVIPVPPSSTVAVLQDVGTGFRRHDGGGLAWPVNGRASAANPSFFIGEKGLLAADGRGFTRMNEDVAQVVRGRQADGASNAVTLWADMKRAAPEGPALIDQPGMPWTGV